MPQNFSELTTFLQQNPLWMGVVILAMLVLVLAVLRLRRYLRATREERKIKRIMFRLSSQIMPNVELPDEVEGSIHVDYLMLTPRGIVVADVQNYRGILFGAENIDYWTQLVGHKSYKFDNPLPFNQNRVQSIKARIPGVHVEGRVVFSSAGSFPKGIPPGVSLIDALQKDLQHLFSGEKVPADIRQAWDDLRKDANFLSSSRVSKKDLF